MNPARWHALMSTPAWDVFMWVETVLAVAFLFECVTVKRAVSGTRRRYLATGVVRTLGLPLIAACLFRFAVDILALDFHAPLDIAGAFVVVYWLRESRGDDDFWSRSWKKLKRRLKGLSLGRRPVFAGIP